jgi:hypothetical protein
VLIFYSYSHRDEKLRDALHTQLAPLVRQGIIKEWYDRQIAPGEEWADEIDEHLEAATIILLLISADFIASDYCWGKEMSRALERHDAGQARVIPIIVRPADWGAAPFGKLQALPKNAKAVTLWSNRDAAWVDVARGIRKTAEEVAAGLTIDRRAGGQPIVTPVEALPALSLKPRLAQRPDGQPHRTIYTANNSTSENPTGTVARKEGDPPTGDVAVDEAYDYLGVAYTFFWDIHERDSIDGQGMPIEAVVHYGQNYMNAFWNGKRLILGDGDGQLFNRFTSGLDVVAREYSKAIIQFETQLIYFNQSGALLLSIADVFGCLVKQYALEQKAEEADWLIGAGILGPAVRGKALRSLAAPGTAYDDQILGKDPQVAHMASYVKTEQDNGGVHINMGIPNHAFYRVAVALGGYAWERAGRIWYETLHDERLAETATFRDFARLTLDNGRRLYGPDSAEARAVKEGWAAVGIKIK